MDAMTLDEKRLSVVSEDVSMFEVNTLLPTLSVSNRVTFDALTLDENRLFVVSELVLMFEVITLLPTLSVS